MPVYVNDSSFPYRPHIPQQSLSIRFGVRVILAIKASIKRAEAQACVFPTECLAPTNYRLTRLCWLDNLLYIKLAHP